VNTSIVLYLSFVSPCYEARFQLRTLAYILPATSLLASIQEGRGWEKTGYLLWGKVGLGLRRSWNF